MENKIVNIGVVTKIAVALKHLRPKVAFVGGAVISLYTDDPAADELRPTKDIDLSVSLEGYGDWVALQEQLAELGFSPDAASKVICRFTYEDVTVDIMPDDEGILGFSNPWYKPGLQKIQSFMLPGGPEIQLLPLPYFLATKFSAFHGRGQGNHRTSHDFEDIVYLTDNASRIAELIHGAENPVKQFLQDEYRAVWDNGNREEIISCHLSPFIRAGRLAVVQDKWRQIIAP